MFVAGVTACCLLVRWDFWVLSGRAVVLLAVGCSARCLGGGEATPRDTRRARQGGRENGRTSARGR